MMTRRVLIADDHAEWSGPASDSYLGEDSSVGE